jgi:hypothetical protein
MTTHTECESSSESRVTARIDVDIYSTWCYRYYEGTSIQDDLVRKAARKARTSDAALCKAIAQVAQGQADDLGGGVFKKRLNDNRHRSIILARSGAFWVYEYLFAKQDRANIDDNELVAFRKLAKAYAGLTARR